MPIKDGSSDFAVLYLRYAVCGYDSLGTYFSRNRNPRSPLSSPDNQLWHEHHGYFKLDDIKTQQLTKESRVLFSDWEAMHIVDLVNPNHHCSNSLKLNLPVLESSLK